MHALRMMLECRSTPHTHTHVDTHTLEYIHTHTSTLSHRCVYYYPICIHRFTLLELLELLELPLSFFVAAIFGQLVRKSTMVATSSNGGEATPLPVAQSPSGAVLRLRREPPATH